MHKNPIIIVFRITDLYAGTEYVYKRAEGKWCRHRVTIRQLVSSGILGDIRDDGDQLLLLTQWLIFTSAGRRRDGGKEMAEQQLSPRQRTDTTRSGRESGQHNTSLNNFKSAILVCTVPLLWIMLQRNHLVYKQDKVFRENSLQKY